MKKFFSNPTVAMVLAVLVVVTSVLINTKVKLGKQCDALSERFYQVSSEEEVSIADSLRALCNASEQLVLLGVKYEVSDTDTAVSTIDEIRNSLRQQSHRTGELFAQYDQLLKQTFSLESDLARITMSESDTDTCAAAQHAAAEAKAAIDRSSYNDAVWKFNRRYGRFPTPQLAKLSGVEMPALFA